VALPERIVLHREGRHGVLPAEMEQQEGRPEEGKAVAAAAEGEAAKDVDGKGVGRKVCEPQ